jgi:hypothetical protein
MKEISMRSKTSRDLSGPISKDTERETREAVTEDGDKTDVADRDLIHGDGGTIEILTKPADQNRDD